MHAHRSRSGRAAPAAVLVGAALLLSACGEENPPQPQTTVELPDIRGPEDLDDPYSGPLTPAFYEDVEAYAEQEVTLLAEVDEVIGPRAFTVVSPEPDVEAGPLLVVSAPDAGDVDPEAGTQLLIAATPVRDFEAEVVAEEQSLDADPDSLEPWDGETFLLATIVEVAD